MIRRAWRYVRTAVTALVGEPGRRREHRELLRELPPLRGSLPEAGKRPGPPSGHAPVFAFAPTWRCGSTLLQRLLMSTGEIWMWGEIYTQAEPLQQMAGMFLPFRDGFPDEDMFPGPEGATDLSGEWIARLSPEPHHLMDAHRRFWERLCAEPARERGRGRWGFKAVNVSVGHAVYMKRLFPEARLVFLVRNPYAAWLSYRRFGNWYATFPNDPVFTVQRFARLWCEHTRQFLESAGGGEGLILRFEELIRGGRALRQLSEHIGSDVDATVLERRISGTDSDRADSTTVVERAVLRRHVGDLADRLGYDPM